jgi:hypothetical protein
MEIYKRHPNVPKQQNSNYKEAWLVKVYGENSGEVILERPFLIFDGTNVPEDEKTPPLRTYASK